MDTARVTFQPEGLIADVSPGTTVHAAAAEAGLVLDAPCGGLGLCALCAVDASGELAPPDSTERENLSPEELASGKRLACRARVLGAVTIEREESLGPMRVEVGGPSWVPSVSPGRTGLAAAADVGTTTLAAALYDLADGRRLATATALNPQTSFGHDVVTRVSRALEGDAEALRTAVAESLSRLLHEMLAAAGGSAVSELVIVGNPTMIHLLLGRDVTPLASAPYVGALREALAGKAPEMGLPGPSDLDVFVGPAISAFVGADAVAGMISTALATREYPALLMDLGTNGELVLRVGGRLFAASAAVGPALEGVTISSGMRAEPGAIERVRYRDGGLTAETVDGTSARGICGSGLLDAIAAMLDAGALRADGRIVAEGPLGDRVSETETGTRFEITKGIVLTQQDVRQVQLAKAAVAVAAEILLEEADVRAQDVREVLISGGFGSRLRPYSLSRLGVLPTVWTDRVTFCGNTALAGAAAMLLDPGLRIAAEREASSVRTVSLAGRPDFEQRFLAALDFPTGG